MQRDEDGDDVPYSNCGPCLLGEAGLEEWGYIPFVWAIPGCGCLKALQSASFGEELPVLTHLGTGHAEPAVDACCTQGFAFSLLRRQCPAAGVPAQDCWHRCSVGPVRWAAGPGAAWALPRRGSLHPGEFSHLRPLIRPTQ